MKTNILKLTAILLVLTGIFCSCQKDGIKLKGTKWKLAGIVDSKTGVLTELEPQDCEECYTLMFLTDTKAEVFAFREKSVLDLSLLGKYMVTDIPRPEGENKFVRALYGRNTGYYSVNSDELKFINNIDKYYILFKRIEP